MLSSLHDYKIYHWYSKPYKNKRLIKTLKSTIATLLHQVRSHLLRECITSEMYFTWKNKVEWTTPLSQLNFSPFKCACCRISIYRNFAWRIADQQREVRWRCKTRWRLAKKQDKGRVGHIRGCGASDVEPRKINVLVKRPFKSLNL